MTVNLSKPDSNGSDAGTVQTDELRLNGWRRACGCLRAADGRVYAQVRVENRDEIYVL